MIKYYKTFLDKEEKRKFFILIFFFIILSFAEIISISLIIPLLELILNEESQSFVSKLLIANNLDLNLKTVLSLFVFSIIFKNLFLIFTQYFNTKFIVELYNKIQLLLIKNYLNKNLIEKNKEHTSETMKNINSEANLFSAGLIGPMMSSISQSILIFFIIFFLLIFNFKVTFIVTFLLLLTALLIKTITGKKLKEFGHQRTVLSAKFFRILKNSFDFAKEIKILKLMEYFSGNFKKNLILQKNIGIKRSIFGQLPKAFSEVIFALFIVIYIYFNIQSQNTNLAFEIGVYVACVVRWMPSINNLTSNYQKIKYSKNSYDNLKFLFKENNLPSSRCLKVTFEDKIILKNLSFSYDDKNLILSNLNLKINRNSKIGIMGSSGSGKTTLINLIMGLIKPTQGQILIDGKESIFGNDLWLDNISYVPQNIVILDDDIKNNITLFNTFREFDQKHYEDVIKLSQLSEVEKKFSKREYNNVGENGALLSFGEKQRIGLARAIYRKSSILILDEPTNFLDKNTTDLFIETLEKNFHDKTIIFLSHDIRDLRICEKIYRIENGNLSVMS